MDDEKFLLGIGILVVWGIVMALCASPQLFRDWLYRIICCRQRKHKQTIEKIKQAQERVRSASKGFLSTSISSGMADVPTQILLHQAVGPVYPEPIYETDHEQTPISEASMA